MVKCFLRVFRLHWEGWWNFRATLFFVLYSCKTFSFSKINFSNQIDLLFIVHLYTFVVKHFQTTFWHAFYGNKVSFHIFYIIKTSRHNRYTSYTCYQVSKTTESFWDNFGGIIMGLIFTIIARLIARCLRKVLYPVLYVKKISRTTR